MNNDQKIDQILERMNSIDITLAKQSIILADHVRRSNLLEAKMVPLERHVNYVEGFLKGMGIIAMVAGLIAAIMEIYKWMQ